MTNPASKSNRRRRLTIAALVLLVLGGGLWWLMRPRFDPRLIGTWTYIRTNERQVSTQRCFQSDGFAYLIRHFEIPGNANTTTNRWRVVDNEIQLLPYHGNDWRGHWRNLVEAINELRGIEPEIVRLKIIEVADNTLKLHQISKSRPLPAADYVRALDDPGHFKK